MGRFKYIKPSHQDILHWIRTAWKPYIQNTSRVLLSAKGWIVFKFLSKDNRQNIEICFWVLGMGSLVLTRWHSGFDPRKETLKKRHLWFILPGFPVQCWNLQGFMAVANTIGIFILIEDEQLMGFERNALRTLVDIDLGDGLPEELDVVWEVGTFIQPLDY